MDTRLNEAAQAGDTNQLYSRIRDDADVLRRIDEAEFVDTPLHIAAARGHTDFAMALMYLKPSLAQKLNQDILSPMHLALENDHDETVRRLFALDRGLVRVKGKDGRTPLHDVVRQRKLDLLAQFLMDCPACVEDVTIKGETALHIAVQDDNFEALKILARWIQRTDIHGKLSKKHVLDLKDTDGRTVLHIAATNAKPETIKLLLECDVDTKETNMRGLTAFNVLESQSKSDARERSLLILRNLDRRYWNRFKALFSFSLEPFKALFSFPLVLFKAFSTLSEDRGTRKVSLQRILRSKVTWPEKAIISLLNLSAERISALLVVLALILTATYEAMLTPPGILLRGISGTYTVAKEGATIKHKTSFDTFIVINFLVFLYTSFVTVGLLQIATGDDSGIVIKIIELLLSALISCLAILVRFMFTSNPPKSGLLRKSTPWLLTIGAFVTLEMARRITHRVTSLRRLKYFKNI